MFNLGVRLAVSCDGQNIYRFRIGRINVHALLRLLRERISRMLLYLVSP